MFWEVIKVYCKSCEVDTTSNETDISFFIWKRWFIIYTKFYNWQKCCKNIFSRIKIKNYCIFIFYGVDNNCLMTFLLNICFRMESKLQLYLRNSHSISLGITKVNVTIFLYRGLCLSRWALRLHIKLLKAYFATSYPQRTLAYCTWSLPKSFAASGLVFLIKKNNMFSY